METLIQDLRFAVRQLRRAPGLAVLAVLCMGLGIGAVTTMYSTAVAFTFRPRPQVGDPDRVVHVWEGPAQAPGREDGMSAAVLQDVRRLSVFSGVAAMRYWSANITGRDQPEQVSGVRASAGSLGVVLSEPQPSLAAAAKPARAPPEARHS